MLHAGSFFCGCENGAFPYLICVCVSQTQIEKKRLTRSRLPPKVGGPPQDLPKFQMPCLTPKSVQTCCNYSPDGDCKVWFKKFDPFMPNGRPIVLPPVVTSDWTHD